MGLSEARDAARLLIDRADKGIPIEAPAPHPRSSDVLTLGGLFDRYETLRTKEGKRIKTLPEAMRADAAALDAVSVAASRRVLARPICAPPVTPWSRPTP